MPFLYLTTTCEWDVYVVQLCVILYWEVVRIFYQLSRIITNMFNMSSDIFDTYAWMLFSRVRFYHIEHYNCIFVYLYKLIKNLRMLVFVSTKYVLIHWNASSRNKLKFTEFIATVLTLGNSPTIVRLIMMLMICHIGSSSVRVCPLEMWIVLLLFWQMCTNEKHALTCTWPERDRNGVFCVLASSGRPTNCAYIQLYMCMWCKRPRAGK